MTQIIVVFNYHSAFYIHLVLSLYQQVLYVSIRLHSFPKSVPPVILTDL